MSINKRYYWMKLPHDFFMDARIKKLRKLAGGDTYTVILMRIMLLTIKNNGVYEFEGIEENLSDEISLKIDEKEIDVKATITYMFQSKLIEELDDNKFECTQVKKLIGSETESAERKRKSRVKRDISVTLSHDSHTNVTKCHTELEKEKELEIELDSLSIKRIENFSDFKKYILKNHVGMKIRLPQGNPCKFEPSTILSVGSNSYLHNNYSNEDLSSDDAIKVWNYLFENQSLIRTRAYNE